MKEKILISAPRFYGIDEAIRDSWEYWGYKAVLKNYRTKSTLQEKIARRLSIKCPFSKPIFNPLIKYYLDVENRNFLNMVREGKPDLLFVIKGDHLLPDTLNSIKNELKIPIIAYIWDDPFYSYAGFYADDYRKFNFEKGMHLYDYIFVYDKYHVEAIKQRGRKNTEYLPLACDPKRYRNMTTSEEDRKEFGYDVCFVGVPYPNRVEVLDSLSEYKLGVFGDGWVKYFLLRGKKLPSYYRGKAIGEKVQKIYRSSKIVLNIHDPEAKEGLNTRTFDILACGASELVDYKKGLETHFKIGEEIISYKNLEELHQLVDYYYRNTKELQEISKKGRERVLRDHTWNHRVEKIIATIAEKKLFCQSSASEVHDHQQCRRFP